MRLNTKFTHKTYLPLFQRQNSKPYFYRFVQGLFDLFFWISLKLQFPLPVTNDPQLEKRLLVQNQLPLGARTLPGLSE